MGDLSEFSRGVRLFLRAYPWRRIEPTPWTPLRAPLAKSRVAILSSAGFHLPEQAPFDETIRGGDTSFRAIPRDADLARLENHHRSESFDHSGMLADPNLALPLDRLKELEARGRIGSVAETHWSFMGSITAPGRLVSRSAPEAVARLVEDEVDVALLVPV